MEKNSHTLRLAAFLASPWQSSTSGWSWGAVEHMGFFPKETCDPPGTQDPNGDLFYGKSWFELNSTQKCRLFGFGRFLIVFRVIFEHGDICGLKSCIPNSGPTISWLANSGKPMESTWRLESWNISRIPFTRINRLLTHREPGVERQPVREIAFVIRGIWWLARKTPGWFS